ncbi:MAG: hypothetical protein US09_C0002G0054 [Candidatus Moranbacteria bacterium GW2011_GWD1_36_198]|nr:MAG: hypothetical protein US09_C0002G0054 [Candidatus Moranbacteria bacterium GW2011_GWD1_36_198]
METTVKAKFEIFNLKFEIKYEFLILKFGHLKLIKN